jgi:hypothetical protein
MFRRCWPTDCLTGRESVAQSAVDGLRGGGSGNTLQYTAALDLLASPDSQRTRRERRHPELTEDTLRIKSELPPADDADLVSSLLNLAAALTASGDFDRATTAAARAVSLVERHASAPTAARRHDEALTTLRRSLALKEASLPAAMPRVPKRTTAS